MRTKNMIIIVVAAIIICAIGVGAYYLTQSEYKTISMTGITIEVPNSDTTVNNNSANYNTYDDHDNNLSIKTWALRDLADANGTAQAVIDIGLQYGSNLAQNVTYNNVSVSNKSGTYSYYETDEQNKCIILITGTNIDAVTHAAKSINKTGINPVGGNTTLANLTLNNTTNTTTLSTATPSSSKSQSTSKSRSSSSNKPDYTDTDQYKKGYIDENGYTTGKGQFQEAGLSPREQQKRLQEIGDS
ncbi:hypothetical protein OTK55_06525 [Methanosphaera sp. Vir-13MRS]|uniref:hypothetical protein n=1 Tax=Candidatus Methanosphaera massiliense TaxID=3017187 RepID=UPI00238048F8|nr:hypothetical protein [Candidatus Methanosphaera massiliense]MDE4078670.1 hypothetical protein [Candidatus Methanosphaera massiliense]